MGPTRVDEDVVEIGKVSVGNPWLGGECCGEDIFNVRIELQSRVDHQWSWVSIVQKSRLW